MLLLYHGTSLESCDRICKDGIDCLAGRPFVDFGQGFYTTPSLEKAKIWAEHKDTGTGCCVVEFCFDIELAQKRGMIKIFEQPDWEWAQFIMNNRIGDDYVRKMEYKVHNLNRQFHIVCGAIADGYMAYILQIIKQQQRPILMEEVELLNEAHYPLQYTFHTDEATSLLTINKVHRGPAWRCS